MRTILLLVALFLVLFLVGCQHTAALIVEPGKRHTTYRVEFKVEP